MFMARFRRLSDGEVAEFPMPAHSLEEADALARHAAETFDAFPVELVGVYPVTVRVIELELPPVPESGDVYWPAIPDGLLRAAAQLLFMFFLTHRD
jgi:hypothetical protein